MCGQLREGLLSVVLSRVNIHQVILVDPILDQKVNEHNHWDKRRDCAKENTYGPDYSNEGQLVPLVEKPCIFELLGAQLHVSRLQIKDELLELACDVVRAVKGVYGVAEKTETDQEAGEKVRCLESFH